MTNRIDPLPHLAPVLESLAKTTIDSHRRQIIGVLKPASGRYGIDLPAWRAVKEFAPYKVVVGNGTPASRNRSTCEHRRQVKEQEQIKAEFRWQLRYDVWVEISLSLAVAECWKAKHTYPRDGGELDETCFIINELPFFSVERKPVEVHAELRPAPLAGSGQGIPKPRKKTFANFGGCFV